MSQAEQTKSQPSGATSRLSAEAQSFVPGQLVQQQQAEGGKGADNDLSQLPRYITSCYPFVKEDQGHGHRAGPWKGSGKSQSSNHAGSGKRLSTSHSQPGIHNIPGVRPANRVHLRATPGPRLAFAPQGPLPPGFVGRGHCPPHLNPAAIHGMPPYYHAGFQQMPVPNGWLPQTGSFPLDYTAQFGPRMFVPTPLTGAGEGTEGNTDECTKSSERKTKKKKSDSGGMVSIGIQNESGVQRSGSTSKKKSKPRTLMCMDAAIQTDFSDEIANLTLMEKPSLLYRKDRSSTRSWFQQYSQDSSTDSEEVDSDSGYSSPLHRRNQMSNGTHPIPAGMAFLPYPPIAAPGQSNPVLIDNKLVTAYNPYMMANPAMHYAYTNTHTVPYTDNYGAQMMRAGYRMPVPGVMHLTPSTISNISPISNNSDISLKSPVKSPPKAKTDPSKPLQQDVTIEEQPVVLQSPEPRKKRRRSRRQNKKKKKSVDDDNNEAEALSDEPTGLQRTLSSSNVSRTSTLENEDALHFEDEGEFPNLLSASGCGAAGSAQGSASVLSYSDILKNQAPQSSRESSISSTTRCMAATTSGSASGDGRRSSSGIETKTARKRRKRREMANRAADEELAEITLEQQVLKELSSKGQKQQQNSGDKEPSKSVSEAELSPALVPAPAPAPVPVPQGKKSKQPMSLSIADMITALEEKRHSEIKEPVKKSQQSVTNLLDSTAPVKRGKEREVPKPKKPSPLKKVILKEREEKKRLRLLEDGDPSVPVPPGEDDSTSDPAEAAAETRLPDDSDLSQEASGSRDSSMEFNGTPASAEMSPISQTSPISMSPLSGSPLSSGINSPIAGNGAGSMDKSVLMKIHSRRYREYCNQVLDKEIDVVCTQLLQDLVHFHDRLFHKDPTKAKNKRRIVLGLREVTKHLRLNKIKCVIISPNLERIQSKGGLDEALNIIIQLCTEQPVPFVFALGRRALGRACAKLVPVSVVGIFNYEGTEEQYQKMMELTEAGRQAYTNMVSMLQTELADNPKSTGAMSGNVGGFQQLFPHLGHSRTPSACSAISFTSSILSEPISENYPQSEPETDSRGYEIVRPNAAQQDAAAATVGSVTTQQADATTNGDNCDELNGRAESPGSSNDGKITIVEMLDEIDEGHEADTEDDQMTSHSHRSDKLKTDTDLMQELPHIDSIHSTVGDLSAEILSQHSSKTLDLNAAEAQSTHSSRTLEGGSGAVGQKDKVSVRSEPREAAALSNGSPQQRARTIDKERIESWVAETQKQIEHIDIHQVSDINYLDDDNDVVHEDGDMTGGSDTDELESSAEDMKDR